MSPQYEYSLLQGCGEGTFISANVEIRRPHLVTVGKYTAIDSGFYCTVSADIGDYVHIPPYVTAIGGAKGYLKMDHFSTVAAGTRIICGSDDYMGAGLVGPTIPDEYKDNLTIEPVVFEKFANIGTNVIVMPGVTLAEGTVVGAGSLVTRPTKPWTVYVGSPARPLKARPKDKIIEYAKSLGYEV